MRLELFSIVIYYARDDIERIMWQLNDNCAQLARAAAESNLCPIYFIGSSSEIVPATPVENILAFYGAVYEYDRYPINI